MPDLVRDSEDIAMHRAVFALAFVATLMGAASGLPAEAQFRSARLACEPAAGRLRVDVTPEVAETSEPRGADVATYTRMVKTRPYPVAGQGRLRQRLSSANCGRLQRSAFGRLVRYAP